MSNPFQQMFQNAGIGAQQVNQGMAWASPKLQQLGGYVNQKISNKNKKAGDVLGKIGSLIKGAGNMVMGGQGFAQNMTNMANAGANALGTMGSVVQGFKDGGFSGGMSALGSGLKNMAGEAQNVYNGLGYADGRSTAPQGGQVPIGGQQAMPTTPSVNTMSNPQNGGSMVSELQNYDRGAMNHVTPNQYQNSGVNSGSMEEQLRMKRQQMGFGSY